MLVRLPALALPFSSQVVVYGQCSPRQFITHSFKLALMAAHVNAGTILVVTVALGRSDVS